MQRAPSDLEGKNLIPRLIVIALVGNTSRVSTSN